MARKCKHSPKVALKWPVYRWHSPTIFIILDPFNPIRLTNNEAMIMEPTKPEYEEPGERLAAGFSITASEKHTRTADMLEGNFGVLPPLPVSASQADQRP